MLAAGIVQETFAGEAGSKRIILQATSTATSTGTFIVRSLALEFHSQNSHTRMGIINRRTSYAHDVLMCIRNRRTLQTILVLGLTPSESHCLQHNFLAPCFNYYL